MNKYQFVTVVFGLMASTATLITLITSWFRYQEKKIAAAPRPADPAQEQRLARIETAVEAVAVEIERISEAQRFTARLLTERQGIVAGPLTAAEPRLLQHHDGGHHGT